jgi:hypothetical protein
VISLTGGCRFARRAVQQWEQPDNTINSVSEIRAVLDLLIGRSFPSCRGSERVLERFNRSGVFSFRLGNLLKTIAESDIDRGQLLVPLSRLGFGPLSLCDLLGGDLFFTFQRVLSFANVSHLFVQQTGKALGLGRRQAVGRRWGRAALAHAGEALARGGSRPLVTFQIEPVVL